MREKLLRVLLRVSVVWIYFRVTFHSTCDMWYAVAAQIFHFILLHFISFNLFRYHDAIVDIVSPYEKSTAYRSKPGRESVFACRWDSIVRLVREIVTVSTSPTPQPRRDKLFLATHRNFVHDSAYRASQIRIKKKKWGKKPGQRRRRRENTHECAVGSHACVRARVWCTRRRVRWPPLLFGVQNGESVGA